MTLGKFARIAFGGWLGLLATAGLAAATTWAIRGDLVLPDQDTPKSGWLLFDDASILKVDCAEQDIPADAHRYVHDGYIFPSLIDCHNHAEWNAIPQWRTGRKFRNRYEWQQDPLYILKVKDKYYKQIHDNKLDYASLKYAEIRAVIGGTTVLQSTYAVAPPPQLVRNLDSDYQADSRIADIMQFEKNDVDSRRFRLGLASGKTRRIFLHIAEGKRNDPESVREFPELDKVGLIRPGVVVIHGVALTSQQLQRMAENSMYLVWSPKSNDVLYGETAPIEDAIDAGVTIALALTGRSLVPTMFWTK